MAFRITPNVHVERDKDGVGRHLRHLQEPYTPTAAGITVAPAPTPQSLASQYVSDVAPIYKIDAVQLTDLNKRPSKKMTDEGTQLRFVEQKSIMETTVLSYVQTHYGLPIWEAGVSVTLHDNDLRVTSSQSTVHFDIEVEKPDPKAKFKSDGITATNMFDLIDLKEDKTHPTINRTRLLIYRYDLNMRFDPESREKQKKEGIDQPPPTLPLPPVPKTIKDGKHYVVVEVLFTLPAAGRAKVNWRAFVEMRTGAVLYLRAFVASAFGNVFEVDPVTATGNTTITACSAATDLDPLVSLVNPLQGLIPPANPADPQELSGEFVKLQDINSPTIAPPTAALPAGDFSFLPVTDPDDFSAVNAYYHCDNLFRMMQGLGFTIAAYFDGTTFPVPVDHRGKGGVPNAHCDGDILGDGIGEFAFGIVQNGCPVGIAASARVVWHEFGHALLWDSVHSPNFGFAHSAGDSLAAILYDPGSQAGDRFQTFPWVPIVAYRRHDRAISAGWAWGGTSDTGSYNSEQILSTTLFRIYRAVGGDDVHPNAAIQLVRRQFAARYMAYLIIRGIGSLATTPVTPTATPNVFATALMNADTGTVIFDGHPGGAFHKVIRWGFEKQGLYQPVGAPTPVTTEGDPPDVDVYVEDGRNGEYQYQWNFWNSTDMWNRLAADGGAAHETPVVGVSNYMYVRVKNRGTQTANNVVVKAYHCKPGTGLVWPGDWKAMVTASLPAPGPIVSSGDTVVGPFEWIPEVVGHECLLAVVSATGDLSNADTVSALPSATGPIPHWRLVPYDNNIGQRNVAPVPGGGGGLNLAKSFERRHFWANNPYGRDVRIVLEPIIPDFLLERKWGLRFLNAGGASFTLGPRANREIIMDLKQGEDFSPSDVEAAGTKVVIEVLTLIDSQVVGGMSYAIDPKMKTPAPELPEDICKPDCSNEAKRLLDCLNVPTEKVKSVRIKRITVDIDLKEDC